MPIVLHMEPTTAPMSWAQFCATKPPFAIALDGYVADGPKQYLDPPTGPQVNFNHHEGVYRPATRATCAQVLVEVRIGLFDRFRDGDGPRANVYANDCDEDVCTAWTILRHHHLFAATINPLVNRLVAIEDMLDTFAGGYPYPQDLPALRELAWVFDPYRRFRLSGGIGRRDESEFRGIVADVEYRILAHIAGNGQAIPLDLRYEVVRYGNGWMLVREIGAHARTAMLADGIPAFVSVRERPNGRRTITVGKFKLYAPGNLSAICTEFNELEQMGGDSWGGGTNVIGSPRVLGTGLSDDAISGVLNRHFGKVV